MALRLPRVFRLDRTASKVAAPASPLQTVQLDPPDVAPAVVFDPARAAARPRAFERSLTDFVARRHIGWILRELQVNVVLDVGANVGQYADMIRRSGYTGQIVSFEPVADLSAALRRRARRDDRWSVHDYALGEEDGEADINVVPGTMSSLLPASDFGKAWSARLKHTRTETIRIRRLADVFGEVIAGIEDPRVYLKMDTQGFDLHTFRGAGDRISDLLGLQSEVSCVPIYDGMPTMAEQLTEYQRAGFEITGMFPVSRDKPTLRIIEFDVVMIGPRALSERAEERAGRAGRAGRSPS